MPRSPPAVLSASQWGAAESGYSAARGACSLLSAGPRLIMAVQISKKRKVSAASRILRGLGPLPHRAGRPRQPAEREYGRRRRRTGEDGGGCGAGPGGEHGGGMERALPQGRQRGCAPRCGAAPGARICGVFPWLSSGEGLRVVAAPLCGPGGHGALPVLGSQGSLGCQECQQQLPVGLGKGCDPTDYFP